MRSAEIAGEGWEEEELSPFEQWLKEKLGDKINDILIYFSVFISLLLGMGLFFVLPVAIGNLFKTLVPTWHWHYRRLDSYCDFPWLSLADFSYEGD